MDYRDWLVDATQALIVWGSQRPRIADASHLASFARGLGVAEPDDVRWWGPAIQAAKDAGAIGRLAYVSEPDVRKGAYRSLWRANG